MRHFSQYAVLSIKTKRSCLLTNNFKSVELRQLEILVSENFLADWPLAYFQC